MSQTSSMACSAHLPSTMRLLTSSIMKGSLAMVMWPTMISASFSPTVTFMRSACFCVFSQKASRAAL